MGKRGWRERNACVGVDSQTGLYLSTLKIHPRERHILAVFLGRRHHAAWRKPWSQWPHRGPSAGLQEGLKLRKGPVRQGPAAGRATTKLR